MGNGGTGGQDCGTIDDGNPCTTDACTNGSATHTPLPSGSKCSASGNVCNDLGACVECMTATDCPAVNTACTIPFCIAGKCQPEFVAAGEDALVQTMGDCKKTSCDGQGNEFVKNYNFDPPTSQNPCEIGACDAGVPSFKPLPAGTGCGNGLICDATGQCVGCITPFDCPGQESECQQKTCTAGMCGFTFAPAGTLLSQQTAGDCKKSVCNGQGMTTIQLDDLDIAEDGNSCTTETCVAGVPQSAAKADGTSCVDGNACTLSDMCLAGVCQAGNAMMCASGLNCVDGSCLATCSTQSGFPGRPILPTPVNPEVLAHADFDGDGDVDLVAGHYDTQNKRGISVFYNSGDGRFSAGTSYLMGELATKVTTGDFNGDGKPDIAASSYQFNKAFVLLNQGPNGFSLTNTIMLTGAGALASAQLNGDTFADLIVVSQNGVQDTINVYMSMGNGSFQAPTAYPAGSTPAAVTTGDLNGDGKQDIAVATYSGGTARVYLNNGNGTFATGVAYQTASTGNGIVAADLNGDGSLDLATSNQFSSAASVLLNNGDGTFKPYTQYPTGTNPQGIQSLDVNGDGWLDLAVLSNDGGVVSILPNNGAASFFNRVDYPIAAIAYGLTSADFNGDGKLDLATSSYRASGISFLFGSGTSFANQLQSYTIGKYVTDVAAADVNGDGLVDAVTADSSQNKVGISLNQGNAVFGAATLLPAVNGPKRIMARDLTGDGRPDLVVGSSTMGILSVMLNAGNGTFGPKIDYTLGNYHVAYALGDLDGDSFVDIAAIDNNKQKVSVFRNDGTGHFGAPVDLGPFATLQSLEMADMNADGKLDLVVADDGTLTILLNLGNGTFATGMKQPKSMATTNLVPADLNGDHRPDIVSLSGGQPSWIQVFMNDGTGQLNLPTNLNVATYYSDIEAVDVDGNGHFDLVAANASATTLAVFRSNGDGTLASPVDYIMHRGLSRIAPADLNADGRIDFLAAASDVMLVVPHQCLP